MQRSKGNVWLSIAEYSGADQKRAKLETNTARPEHPDLFHSREKERKRCMCKACALVSLRMNCIPTGTSTGNSNRGCQCKDSTDSASVPTGLQSATSADAAPFTAQCVHGQHWNATAISFYCHLLDHKCVCVGVRRSSRHSVCSYGCSYGCSFSFFVRLVLLAFSYGLLACSYGLTA